MTTKTPTEADMYMALELEDKVSLRIWETMAATLSYAPNYPTPLGNARNTARQALHYTLPNDMDFVYNLARNAHFRGELADQLRNDVGFRAMIQSIVADTVREEVRAYTTTTGDTTHAYKRP